MKPQNPYQPSNVSAANPWSPPRRLALAGLLLLTTAGFLFYTAEEITVYTPYSTTTLWSTSSLDDQYFVDTVPIQVMLAFGCAASGAVLLIAASILRVLRPAFRGRSNVATLARSSTTGWRR